MYAIYYPAAKGREVKNADQIWKEETALESAMHPSSQRCHLTAGDGVTLCRHFAEAWEWNRHCQDTYTAWLVRILTPSGKCCVSLFWALQKSFKFSFSAYFPLLRFQHLHENPSQLEEFALTSGDLSPKAEIVSGNWLLIPFILISVKYSLTFAEFGFFLKLYLLEAVAAHEGKRKFRGWGWNPGCACGQE